MAEKAGRVCVVGSVNVDLTFRAARLPRAGETLTAEALHVGFGGKGANQAVMAALLGARVNLIARVGDDVFGSQALENLRSRGVNVDHIGTTKGQPTGVAAIIVEASAQNCILIAGGANQVLTEADIAMSARIIAEANVVLGQLEVPLATTLAAFRIARKAEVRTVLNPAPAQPLSREILTLTDLLIPNESELASLTGQPADTLDDIVKACRSLLSAGPQHILVTLGARGALLVDTERATYIPALPVNAVDTTGAGDAFIGSFAVLWARGLDLFDAMKKACAVAAISVTRPGTQTSFPSIDEVEFISRKKMLC